MNKKVLILISKFSKEKSCQAGSESLSTLEKISDEKENQ